VSTMKGEDRAGWMVVGEDVPSIGLHGNEAPDFRRFILLCPNDDFAILSVPATLADFNVDDIGGTLNCPACKKDWPAPPG
jgi:hypothetical protein